jgi:hypothetical protein
VVSKTCSPGFSLVKLAQDMPLISFSRLSPRHEFPNSTCGGKLADG